MSDTFSGGTRVTTPTTTTPATAEQTSSGADTTDLVRELNVRHYRDYFGVTTPDADADVKVEYIVKKLNPDGKLETNDVLKVLRRLSDKLGEGTLGEGRLSKAYRYLRLVDNVQEALLQNL